MAKLAGFSFTKELSDTTIYEEVTAKVSCEVNNERAEVIWSVNDVDIGEGDPYEMSCQGCIRQLLIHGIHLGYSGMKITARVGEQMTTANIMVKASHFSTQIRDVTIKEGDSAVFSCQVRNNNDTVHWFVNGHPTSCDERYTEIKRGAKRELLIPNCKKSDDETQIYVDINNEERAARLHVVASVDKKRPLAKDLHDELITKKAKQSEMHLSEVIVYAEEDAEFSFTVNQEETEVSWFINNLEATGERYKVSSQELVRKLVIKDTTLTDNDSKVTFKIGNVEKLVHLKVNASNFLIHIDDVVVEEGDTAVFSCQVRNVADTVKWFFNGGTISNNVRFTETKKEQKRRLQIHHTSLSDNETPVFVNIRDEKRKAQLYVRDLTENKRRWLAVSTALGVVISPLRIYVHQEMDLLWQKMESIFTISRQSCPPRFLDYKGKTLNYEAINGNQTNGKQINKGRYNTKYDFTVKTPVDLAKLFLQSHMSHMTGFDNTCDMSAALNIIIGADLCVKKESDQVKEKVRNRWGHFNFKEWDPCKFNESFGLMRELVKALKSTNEESILAELENIEKFDTTHSIVLTKDDWKHLFIKEIDKIISSTYIDTDIRREAETKYLIETYRMDHSKSLLKCVFVVIKIFPRILSKLLESSGSSAQEVYTKVKMEKYFRKQELTSEQEDILQTLLTDGYTQLDFTLMVRIISYFRLISAPSRGWDSTPTNTEIEVGDDVQRLKLKSESVLNRVNVEISEEEFETFFSETTMICGRIDSYLSSEDENSFKQEVEGAKLQPLTDFMDMAMMYDQKRPKEVFLIKTGEYVFRVYNTKSITDLKQIFKENRDHEPEKDLHCTLTVELDVKIPSYMKANLKEVNSKLVNVTVKDIREGSLIIDILVSKAILFCDDLLQTELQKLLAIILSQCDFETEIDNTSFIPLLMSVYEAFQEDGDTFQQNIDGIFTRGLVHFDLKVNKDIVQSEDSLHTELENLLGQIVSVSNGDQLLPIDRPIVSIIHPTRYGNDMFHHSHEVPYLKNNYENLVDDIQYSDELTVDERKQAQVLSEV